jgi:hypothetical protein
MLTGKNDIERAKATIWRYIYDKDRTKGLHKKWWEEWERRFNKNVQQWSEQS